jgi:hypothetical protein
MNAAALAAGAATTFALNNTFAAAEDVVVLTFATGQASFQSYNAWANISPSGVVNISLKNISGGSLSEAVAINFAIIKGAVA